jgi:hypothetical protein
MEKKTTFWGKGVMYTIHMVFARAEKAQKLDSENVKIAAWVYTALLVVMVVSQLIAFEDFTPLISSGYLPGHPYGEAALIAGLIVFTEVFAVPFLLRMALSPLMRWFSLICSLVAPALWAKLTIEAVVGNKLIDNYGLFGSKVPLHSGTIAVVLSLVLLALAIWSAWGMWPARKK